MNHPDSIVTWNELKGLGFEPNAEVSGGLKFDFGNFKLSAHVYTIGLPYGAVEFFGILQAPGSFGEVCFKLPPMVASREQLAAFLVYYLDKAADGGVFESARKIGWISDGRLHRNLLPWEADLAAYHARQHCSVRRDWLRFALKRLMGIVADADDAAEVEFGFDGSILTIECIGQVVPMAANGKAWDAQFVIPAGELRRLPKRLTQTEVEVSVCKGRLHIGRNCFSGAKEKLP